ncbi:unnamed protein product [Gongylonema pulchrum]|uniref:Leucine-rich repeat domain-containing protein n=1 Tax=Gongylonema pulchrum TaxID=637853 RepID=A0A183D293_9BILA|nr:unnamed protein product [Gongylonema pulchrum]
MNNNGLVRMPTLEMTSKHRFALELIDFSYNHIEYLGDGQLRAVHANKIQLNNNDLREIGSHVFANCQFSLLMRRLETVSLLASMFQTVLKAAFEVLIVIYFGCFSCRKLNDNFELKRLSIDTFEDISFIKQL